MQKNLPHRPKVQFFRYAIVGGLSTLVDLLIYYFLYSLWTWGHWPALTLSFTGGLCTNFILSREWAFGAKGEPRLRQFTRFVLVILTIYGANGLLMKGLYKIMPPIPWQPLIIRGVSAIGTLPLSFYLHRTVSFRVRS